MHIRYSVVKSPTLRHLSCIKTFKESKQVGIRKCLTNQTQHSSYLLFTENTESIRIFNIGVEAGNQKQDFYNTSICTNKCTNTDTHTCQTETDWQDSCTTHPTYTHHCWNTSGGDSLSSVLTCMPCDLKHLSFPLVLYHTVLHSACKYDYRPRPIIITPQLLDLINKEKKSHKQLAHPWLWGG